ncbi:hypothetical protein J6590_023686 [Homalodisca vitripennis]|nr:hypothetical protein J6590_023686 [Homalodisca vitripennis]
MRPSGERWWLDARSWIERKIPLNCASTEGQRCGATFMSKRREKRNWSKCFQGSQADSVIYQAVTVYKAASWSRQSCNGTSQYIAPAPHRSTLHSQLNHPSGSPPDPDTLQLSLAGPPPGTDVHLMIRQHPRCNLPLTKTFWAKTERTWRAGLLGMPGSLRSASQRTRQNRIRAPYAGEPQFPCRGLFWDTVQVDPRGVIFDPISDELLACCFRSTILVEMASKPARREREKSLLLKVILTRVGSTRLTFCLRSYICTCSAYNSHEQQMNYLATTEEQGCPGQSRSPAGIMLGSSVISLCSQLPIVWVVWLINTLPDDPLIGVLKRRLLSYVAVKRSAA